MVDSVYRAESRRILATLIRPLGDFDPAEEALQEAFAAAVEQWPRDGLPANAREWLVSAGRFKAIVGMRRRARFDASLPQLAAHLKTDMIEGPQWEDDGVGDDRLRLIFTCCHPALAPEARIALTQREEPSPVAELNRAVAVAMHGRPQAGLELIVPSPGVASWPTTIWRTRRGPTCAGGWEGLTKPEPRTGRHSP